MVRTLILTTLLVTAATAASAQIPPQPPPVASPLMQGTEQERAACHPDVVRFCRDLIKDDNNADVFAILNCLQTNRNRLSRACGEVLISHGQ